MNISVKKIPTKLDLGNLKTSVQNTTKNEKTFSDSETKSSIVELPKVEENSEDENEMKIFNEEDLYGENTDKKIREYLNEKCGYTVHFDAKLFTDAKKNLQEYLQKSNSK